MSCTAWLRRCSPSTTRETVARVLGDLSRIQLVKREDDKLVILDVEKLEDMIEQFRGS